MKRFFKKHKHVLMDIALDEAAEPVMDLANVHIHHDHQLLVILPPLSLSFGIYILLILFTIFF